MAVYDISLFSQRGSISDRDLGLEIKHTVLLTARRQKDLISPNQNGGGGGGTVDKIHFQAQLGE